MFEYHVNNIVCKSGTFEFLPGPKRQGLPEQDIPSNNMNSEKNLVAKMNDTATLQNEPKRILNISVIMRKIRLNLYVLPPGFKGLNGIHSEDIY